MPQLGSDFEPVAVRQIWNSPTHLKFGYQYNVMCCWVDQELFGNTEMQWPDHALTVPVWLTSDTIASKPMAATVRKEFRKMLTMPSQSVWVKHHWDRLILFWQVLILADRPSSIVHLRSKYSSLNPCMQCPAVLMIEPNSLLHVCTVPCVDYDNSYRFPCSRQITSEWCCT